MRKFRITQSCQEYYLIEAEDEDGAFAKLYSGELLTSWKDRFEQSDRA